MPLKNTFDFAFCKHRLFGRIFYRIIKMRKIRQSSRFEEVDFKISVKQTIVFLRKSVFPARVFFTFKDFFCIFHSFFRWRRRVF